MFVANHSSHLDTPLILCSLPAAWRRRTAVAAAADYFFDTWWRAAGSAMVFNTFPIERRGGSLSPTPGTCWPTAGTCGLPRGHPLAGRLGAPFRLGAACAGRASTGCRWCRSPIRGSFAAMPRGRGWPVPGRPAVTVRFGEPLHPVGAGESVRDSGPGFEAAVAELLDEDATTWWEATRRAAAGARPRRPVPRRALAPGLGADRAAGRNRPATGLAPLSETRQVGPRSTRSSSAR